MPLAVEVRPPGVEEDGLPRPPEVLRLLERDQADRRVLGGPEERFPELPPGESLDEREMDGRRDEDAERPEGQGLPEGPPRFVHGVVCFQP